MKIEDVTSIIEKSNGVVLTTINEKGFPESRALFNLAYKKQFPKLAGRALELEGDRITLYLSTNTSSRKVSQVRENQKTSLYFCLPDKITGAGLCGYMTEITDPAFKESFWQRGWEIYYHEGPADPDFALLKFVSEDIRSWYHSNEHTFSTRLPEKTE
jgi:Uncharacterized stress protein (general stress protein 26)